MLSSSGRCSHDPGIQLLLFWIPDQVGNDSEWLSKPLLTHYKYNVSLMVPKNYTTGKEVALDATIQ